VKPIIVRIVETPHDPTGLADVFINALGLSGAITLLAVLLGVAFAAVLFWYRRRHI
jgi:hypothetical protein